MIWVTLDKNIVINTRVNEGDLLQTRSLYGYKKKLGTLLVHIISNGVFDVKLNQAIENYFS